jgi:hypothetical protein
VWGFKGSPVPGSGVWTGETGSAGDTLVEGGTVKAMAEMEGRWSGWNWRMEMELEH